MDSFGAWIGDLGYDSIFEEQHLIKLSVRFLKLISLLINLDELTFWNFAAHFLVRLEYLAL